MRTNPRSKLGASGGWSLAHVIIMLSRGPGFSMKRCFSPCATISCCASCRLPTCGVLRGNGARASGRATWASCRPCGDREVSRRPQSCPIRHARQAFRPAAAPKRAALATSGRVRRVGPSALRAVLGLAAVRRASAPAARIRESPCGASSPRSRLLAPRVLRGACAERGRSRVATRSPSATFPPKRVALLRRISSVRLSPLGARRPARSSRSVFFVLRRTHSPSLDFA